MSIVSITTPAPRILARDKRLINCSQVDVNQLMPLKYNWAWEHYTNQRLRQSLDAHRSAHDQGHRNLALE